MTAPRAVGVRISYADVPPAVTRWVEETLGSAVVSYADQVGGMSPGCAARLVCTDGTRAFVKAVGTELNPDTPTLFRREITVLGLIGEHLLWARLEASYDDGDWVALILEDVEGSHPDLADDAVMDRLLEATDELSGVLHERSTGAAVDGAGGTLDPGLTSQQHIFGQFAAALDAVPDHPEAPVPAWVRADAPSWAARVRALGGDSMATLVHYDIRIDNLLQRPTGEIVFLDWGAAGVGPDWLDPLLARLERVDQDWFDSSLASSAPLARVGDEAVTTWLVGIGTHLAVRSVTAVDVNLPTLQEFRRTESARFLSAAARRHL
ncbi:hypothetical protein J2S40_002620 [Nocardioides luteus]|uniref:Aminoglycoside phosphotransferase domain-containing protein n=1 Tax=Nocardioides luteus TaxID=1844 RepID=A0ABQ5T2B2_9ACTN|nr:phosphotransferase [Nocardioides luteus]MDR7311562.1 hypothetical protein [Nocardioides luteus]GGR54745.1 hypothetical protein GCM10010197_21610 [Nocardioides luteus]GLJ70211.1 hypothetical protein GCM10017579_42470 [Nocardioides luteus]